MSNWRTILSWETTEEPLSYEALQANAKTLMQELEALQEAADPSVHTYDISWYGSVGGISTVPGRNIAEARLLLEADFDTQIDWDTAIDGAESNNLRCDETGEEEYW